MSKIKKTESRPKYKNQIDKIKFVKINTQKFKSLSIYLEKNHGTYRKITKLVYDVLYNNIDIVLCHIFIMWGFHLGCSH